MLPDIVEIGRGTVFSAMGASGFSFVAGAILLDRKKLLNHLYHPSETISCLVASLLKM